MLSLEARERPSVHQILRTEYVRFHIKRFLDKASAMKRKPKQHSSPTPSSKPDPSSQPVTNHKHQQQVTAYAMAAVHVNIIYMHVLTWYLEL